MRLEHLSEEEEDFWRGEFAQENWIFGSLSLSVTLPEFAGGVPALRDMHFGYYLQPLHLNVDDREDLPRKLAYVNVVDFVPGKAFESPLYRYVSGADPDLAMPPDPKKRLPADEIAILKQWIHQGAQS